MNRIEYRSLFFLSALRGLDCQTRDRCRVPTCFVESLGVASSRDVPSSFAPVFCPPCASPDKRSGYSRDDSHHPRLREQTCGTVNCPDGQGERSAKWHRDWHRVSRERMSRNPPGQRGWISPCRRAAPSGPCTALRCGLRVRVREGRVRASAAGSRRRGCIGRVPCKPTPEIIKLVTQVAHLGTKDRLLGIGR